MNQSKSTDKLELLTECVRSVPDDIRRRVKTIKLTWSEFDSYDEAVVCPNIEVELYPPEPAKSAFQTDKPAPL